MSMFDKIAAAVTPMASDEDRRQAREKVRAAAVDGGWLQMALTHHDQIEQALERVRRTQDPSARLSALQELLLVFTAHGVGEEGVLYPALVRADEKPHATKAYTEQSAAKVNLAELETIDPTTQDWLDKFEHVRGAILQHVYEEEGTWFIELQQKLPATAHERLTERFQQEYERYLSGAQQQMGGSGASGGAARDGLSRGTTTGAVQGSGLQA